MAKKNLLTEKGKQTERRATRGPCWDGARAARRALPGAETRCVRGVCLTQDASAEWSERHHSHFRGEVSVVSVWGLMGISHYVCLLVKLE